MSCARTAVVLLTLTACSSPTYDKATPGSASTQDSSDDSGAPDEAEPPDCAEVDVRVTDLRTTPHRGAHGRPHPVDHQHPDAVPGCGPWMAR